MRKIRYGVASSLDGFIAGPHGEIDWIAMDPEIDFAAIFSQFDTLIMGSRTFQHLVDHGRTEMPGVRLIVFSSSLRPEDYPTVAISRNVPETIAALRAQPGKDIWLMGGGRLFRTLLDAGEVDGLDVMILPVLLGDGIPLLPPPYTPARLTLTAHRVSKSGFVSLTYTVSRT